LGEIIIWIYVSYLKRFYSAQETFYMLEGTECLEKGGLEGWQKPCTPLKGYCQLVSGVLIVSEKKLTLEMKGFFVVPRKGHLFYL
jgi:hypothetical protein